MTMHWYYYVAIGVPIFFVLVPIVGWAVNDFKKWNKLSPEEQEQRERQQNEKVTNFIGTLMPSNVISENGVTVSYQVDSVATLFYGEPEKIEEKIRNILRDNPDAIISKHEKALGIKVHAQECAKKNEAPPPPSPGPKGFYG